MIWPIINFLIFIGVLFFLLRKPAREFWRNRRLQISMRLEESARMVREASEKHHGYQKRLNHIEEEAGRLVEELTKEGELEKQKIFRETADWEKRMVGESAKIADQEVRKASAALQKEAALLATEIAEKLIRDHLKEEDRHRLADGYLKRLEEIQ
ncbi:MAG: ATP synthase F0 subunit B [Deltaproteobacteria bacterium]|nr:ATP synthase F0 subunit B [Deltaproteobacteria bacterium]